MKLKIRSAWQPDLTEIDNHDVVNTVITSKPFSPDERMSWFRKFN